MAGLNRHLFNTGMKSIFSNMTLIFKEVFNYKKKIYPNEFHLKNAIDWLIYAQKVTKDGGISAGYSLLFGWRPSYPETSGYIIPTLLNYYHITNNKLYLRTCKEIADWECSIQLESGGFQGNVINKNRGPVIFNTGQVILGLLSAYKEFKHQLYLNCATKAGDFLVKNQEKNGNWKIYCFNNNPHTYNVRSAWALLELFKIADEEKYKKAAIRNFNWALSQQNKNGWFENNSFKLKQLPLLHTIGYAIRGFLESGLMLNDKNYIKAALNPSLKLMQYYEKLSFLPTRFDSNWQSKDFYSCLTGDAQLSIIWLKLYQIYGQKKFLENAIKLNNYLKLNQIINSRNINVEGSIKGSDPIWGGYNPFGFPNWATKFFCDALMLEDLILSN